MKHNGNSSVALIALIAIALFLVSVLKCVATEPHDISGTVISRQLIETAKIEILEEDGSTEWRAVSRDVMEALDFGEYVTISSDGEISVG